MSNLQLDLYRQTWVYTVQELLTRQENIGKRQQMRRADLLWRLVFCIHIASLSGKQISLHVKRLQTSHGQKSNSACNYSFIGGYLGANGRSQTLAAITIPDYNSANPRELV
jgi:hypothetical protein